MTIILVYFAYFKGWIFADFQNISPKAAHALLQNDNSITLIDVRSLKKFQKDHIAKASHLSMQKLNTFPTFSEGKKLLVYCERGEVSVEASRILAKRGFEVLNLEGGVIFWIRAGYVLVEPTRVQS